MVDSVEVANPYTLPNASTARACVVRPVIAKFEVVAFVVDADGAKRPPGNMTWFGSESVTAPVAADVVI
jgi:hypothetical protein